MGGNRRLAQPEGYPPVFLQTIEAGAGVIYAADLPWTPLSAVKRFRLCLALLRSIPGHPLHWNAKRRWSVRLSPGGFEVLMTDRGREIPRAHGAIVAAALAREDNRENPTTSAGFPAIMNPSRIGTRVQGATPSQEIEHGED